jgi:hypothetical protein
LAQLAPMPGHIEPLGAQTLLTQHPPPEHVSPIQHESPDPPQVTQTPPGLQIAPL